MVGNERPNGDRPLYQVPGEGTGIPDEENDVTDEAACMDRTLEVSGSGDRADVVNHAPARRRKTVVQTSPAESAPAGRALKGRALALAFLEAHPGSEMLSADEFDAQFPGRPESETQQPIKPSDGAIAVQRVKARSSRERQSRRRSAS